jgi:PAS domain S-box-containing protein
MTVDDNGTIESFNEAAEKIFSYARSEVIGRHVSTVLDAPSSPLTSAMSRRGRARARFTIPAGVVGKRRDGSSFSVELTSADINLRNKQRLVLVVRDASERNRAEAERSRAEARYRSLVEQIPAVTFMGSLNDDLIDFYVSPQIEMLLGFSQEEWLSDPFLWFNQLHPDDRKLCNDEFARGLHDRGPLSRRVPRANSPWQGGLAARRSASRTRRGWQAAVHLGPRLRYHRIETGRGSHPGQRPATRSLLEREGNTAEGDSSPGEEQLAGDFKPAPGPIRSHSRPLHARNVQ